MVYAFIIQKGGVGKTTLAVHFAVWHHERGKRVLFIDTDGQASSSKWIERGKSGRFPASFSFPCVRATDGDDAVNIISSGLPKVDCVVCDSAGGTKDIPRSICLVSDIVVIPTQPKHLDLESTPETIRIIRTAQVARKGEAPLPMLVINGINGINGIKRLNTRLAEEALSLRAKLGIHCAVSSVIERDPVAFTRAANFNQNSVTIVKCGCFQRAK